MIHVFRDLSELCKWQSLVYQSWFCNDCRSSANFACIITITLNSVFHYSLSLGNNLWLSSSSREKQTFWIVKHDWDKWKEVGSTWQSTQAKRYKRRQGSIAALVPEDRADMAPSSKLNAEVPSRGMGQTERNRPTFTTPTWWGPC